MACEGRASGVCPAELAQTASPAVPLALLPSRAASAQRKLFAGSLARPAKGASKGRTSGQLFSVASRVRLPRPTSLCSPGCGLSSALSRGSRTRGAKLATSKAPTAAARSPLEGYFATASRRESDPFPPPRSRSVQRDPLGPRSQNRRRISGWELKLGDTPRLKAQAEGLVELLA